MLLLRNNSLAKIIKNCCAVLFLTLGLACPLSATPYKLALGEASFGRQDATRAPFQVFFPIVSTDEEDVVEKGAYAPKLIDSKIETPDPLTVYNIFGAISDFPSNLLQA